MWGLCYSAGALAWHTHTTPSHNHRQNSQHLHQYLYSLTLDEKWTIPGFQEIFSRNLLGLNNSYEILQVVFLSKAAVTLMVIRCTMAVEKRLLFQNKMPFSNFFNKKTMNTVTPLDEDPLSNCVCVCVCMSVCLYVCVYFTKLILRIQKT